MNKKATMTDIVPSACKKTDSGYSVDLAQMPENPDRYRLMIQSFVPRPIAWVLTENENGSYNLAPFSYSAAVAPTPMTFLFSCGMRRGGGVNKDEPAKKDTWANIERTGHCVLHIPSVDNIEAVNNSAAGLDIGASEAEQFGIETVPFGDFPLPRVKAAPIAFACTLNGVTEIGDPPLGLVRVEAQHIYLAEHIVEEVDGNNIHINEKAIDPLTRLGKTKYGSLGDILDIGPPPKI